MKEKIKGFLNSAKGKALAIGTTVGGTMCAMSQTVFAAGEEEAALTSAVTTGVGEAKTQFLVIAAITVAAAMGLFAIKYAINQGIGIFAKLSKKS